ncbi:MAG TPA: hypothetical protein VE135_12185 [Pyrinomonadaceae bacterium]|nr:hypothetical protein [Pyrinomonadaceae bacterium]
MNSTGTMFALILSALLINAANAQTARTSRQEKTIAAIRAVLDAQRDAWNRGDIDGYMQGYDHSDATVLFPATASRAGGKPFSTGTSETTTRVKKWGRLPFPISKPHS